MRGKLLINVLNSSGPVTSYMHACSESGRHVISLRNPKVKSTQSASNILEVLLTGNNSSEVETPQSALKYKGHIVTLHHLAVPPSLSMPVSPYLSPCQLS